MIIGNPLKSDRTLTEVAEWLAEVVIATHDILLIGHKCHLKSSDNLCRKCVVRDSAWSCHRQVTEALYRSLSSWEITSSENGRTLSKICLHSSVGVTRILWMVKQAYGLLALAEAYEIARLEQ